MLRTGVIPFGNDAGGWMASLRWNRLIGVVAVVLVTAACGDSGSTEPAPTETPSTQTAPLVNAEATAVGAAVVDRLGPEDGFAAVVLALDHGYDVAQVVNGAASVAPDGTIAGVTPSGPAPGLFTESAEAFGGALIVAAGPVVLAAAEEVTIDDFSAVLRRNFDERSSLSTHPVAETVSAEDEDRATVEAMIGGILALVDVGYTLDQIVEGLVLGELHFAAALDPEFDKQDNICIVLASNDGTVIAPESGAGYSFDRTLNCRTAIDDGQLSVLVDGEIVKTSPTTTTPPAEAETPPPVGGGTDTPPEGTYVGEATFATQIPNYKIVESLAEIAISNGQAEMVLDITFDAGLEYSDDVLTCSAVARAVYSGSGTAGTVIEISTPQESVEILSVDGECEDTPLSHWEEREGEAYTFSGTYAEGTITGAHLDGLITITAQGVP
jgi:hypothetical protein